MHDRARVLSALAAAALVLVSSSYLAAARLLRFATLSSTDEPPRAALFLAVVAACALVHERFVRGELYTALRSSLAPGRSAPIVALVGALAPAAARFALLPRPRAPLAIAASHAFLVEALLGFGLTWLALASSTWLFSAAALTLVWAVRLFVVPVFHGGVVPLLEALAALLAALAVAGILARPLAPHRAAVLEMT
ncbi:MAG TPA: hypothetical protein VKF32_14100 [Thermoanaerobaculia bacterium]|nr:hypothetical protein [Thermoanaerobaculia bacterium]